MALQVERESASTLADVIDLILDKGLVINADITVSVVGVELLGIRIRAAVASFETAARYGLEFPAGVNLAAPGWKQVGDQQADRVTCPTCGQQLSRGQFLAAGCPSCGWTGARANGRGAVQPAI